jgi:hypothetical protein
MKPLSGFSRDIERFNGILAFHLLDFPGILRLKVSMTATLPWFKRMEASTRNEKKSSGGKIPTPYKVGNIS